MTAFLVMQLLVTLLPVTSFPVTSFTVTIPHTIPHKYDLDGAYWCQTSNSTNQS
jgi:hypothetical protein